MIVYGPRISLCTQLYNRSSWLAPSGWQFLRTSREFTGALPRTLITSLQRKMWELLCWIEPQKPISHLKILRFSTWSRGEDFNLKLRLLPRIDNFRVCVFRVVGEIRHIDVHIQSTCPWGVSGNVTKDPESRWSDGRVAHVEGIGWSTYVLSNQRLLPLTLLGASQLSNKNAPPKRHASGNWNSIKHTLNAIWKRPGDTLATHPGLLQPKLWL